MFSIFCVDKDRDTTKKKAFNIAPLTSVISKADVNESAMTFL